VTPSSTGDGASTVNAVSTTSGLVRTGPAAAPQPATNVHEHSPSGPTTPVDFNGLPAPWEPLPDWLTTPPPNWPPAPPVSTTTAVPANGSGGFPPSLPMQMAELERELPPPDSQSALASAEDSDHQQSPGHGVEPDLDALARQVYILLRRRLASERRRFG
jgi:hypothetical protein